MLKAVHAVNVIARCFKIGVGVVRLVTIGRVFFVVVAVFIVAIITLVTLALLF